MTKQQPSPVRFLIFWGLSGVVDFPFFLGFVYNPTWLINYQWECLGLHTIAAMLFFFSEPCGKGLWHADRLWARNFVVFMGIFSLFGWIAAILLFFSHRRAPYVSMATVEAEVDFIAKPLESQIMISALSKQERILQELDLMPLSDIMAGDDLDLKRGAIEQLARLKTPEAIELLESHRSDASMDIRFFVTTSLAKVKKEFEEQLHAARESLKKNRYNLDSRCSIARTYLIYARSKLLDDTTAQNYREEAIYHLQFAIMDDDAPTDVFWLLVDIYRENADWEKVLQVVDVLEGRQRASMQEYVGIRANALFALDRFGDVHSAIHKAQQQDAIPKEFTGLANWWCS